jgi:hypothetical protein
MRRQRRQHKKDPSKDFYAVVDVIPAEIDEIKDKFSNPFIFT